MPPQFRIVGGHVIKHALAVSVKDYAAVYRLAERSGPGVRESAVESDGRVVGMPYRRTTTKTHAK